ncbi:MAG: hypothetical protein LBS17_00360 [Actinomycetes bacterium]|jgi:hypothetical protein|nr:hypothetical protein [Actinomycetes bacterium]
MYALGKDGKLFGRRLQDVDGEQKLVYDLSFEMKDYDDGFVTKRFTDDEGMLVFKEREDIDAYLAQKWYHAETEDEIMQDKDEMEIVDFDLLHSRRHGEKA